MSAVGDTYIRLGRLDEASPHLERAAALREEALGADDPCTLESVHALGELRFYQGRTEDADALLHRSFERDVAGVSLPRPRPGGGMTANG